MADGPGLGSAAAAVTDQLSAGAAGAFVHVGRPIAPTQRYLVGSIDVAQPVGFAWLPDEGDYEAVCFAPPRAAGTCRRQFPGSVVETDQHVGAAVADRLDAASIDGPILAVPSIPHDTALYVEQAGYELESTAAVALARRSKTATEQACLERAQQAVRTGIDRARQCLAGTEIEETPELVVDGEPVTVATLRQAIREGIVAEGAVPVAVRVGGPWRNDQDVDERVRRGVPVVVECAARTPEGYHGRLARTVVVDSEGGWDRRAHVAVTNARQAALAVLEAGAGSTIEKVYTEARAELTAYGFAPETSEQAVRVDCHGIGLSRVERPEPGQDSTIETGDVLALEVSVIQEDNAIRLGDVVVIEDGGGRVLVDPSTSLVP